MSEIRQHGRDLIEAARIEQTPSVTDRERVFAAMMAGAAVTTTAATAVAAPTLFGKLASGVAKWWLLGGLCTVAAGGAYVAGRPASVPAPAALAAPRQAPSALAAPADRLAPAEAEAAPAAPALKPADVANATRSSTKSEASGQNLELELSELHAAHAAYRNGHPEQALALIATHKSRFPKSQLAVERSTLEVLSLCRLGRTPQAEQLAAKLRSSAHSAAALSGLEGSCVAAPSK